MFIIRIINWLFNIFEILLIIHVALSWIRPVANKWTVLLDRIVEPVLGPIRRFLQSKLPASAQILDWSPLVALLLLSLLRRILFSFVW